MWDEREFLEKPVHNPEDIRHERVILPYPPSTHKPLICILFPFLKFPLASFSSPTFAILINYPFISIMYEKSPPSV